MKGDGHAMEKPTCRTCPYWARGVRDDGGGRPVSLGNCMRYPPTVTGWDEDEASRSPLVEFDHSAGYFPSTAEWQWCGEHPDFPAYLARSGDLGGDEPLRSLGLGRRTLNCLAGAGVRSVGQLIRRTEVDLLGLPNLGEGTLREIERALASRGLMLADYDHGPASDVPPHGPTT